MTHWRKFLVSGIGALGLLGLTTASVGADEGNLLEFGSMTPVTGTAVGTVNDRGITGGGLPWAITEGQGQVDAQGNLEVQVEGLIIPLPIINGQPGNPIAHFSATVSCLTPTGVVNVTTGLFPASVPGGDSEIEAHVNLPAQCGSPELFVGTTTPTGKFVWFARSDAAGQDAQN